MMKIVDLNKEDKRFIFDYTANQLNLHPIIIEKDFWICYILDYLFNKSKYKNAFTFKGGTSLSKSYNVISRMSEDIDIILNWEVLGVPQDEPLQERSKRQQEIYNKKIKELTIDFLENILYQDLVKGLGYVKELSVELISQEQLINIYYPQTYESLNVGILPCIRLEIGALAAWNPANNKEISPYINNYLQVYSLPNIIVRTVSIGRTFYEN